MSDCIFCRIAAGEIPVEVVYEDEHVLAFDDVTPQAPVHTLIIPRRHFTSLQNDVPPEVLAAVFGAVRVVADIKGVGSSGHRVIVNSGPDANQSVAHLHVHLLGGRAMSHGMVNFA